MPPVIRYASIASLLLVIILGWHPSYDSTISDGDWTNCSIDPPTITTTCNDNGTPADPTDDTFSYTIFVSGLNTGASYGIDYAEGSCDDCCLSGEKVGSITMLYTGEECAASNNQQAADKWDCSGDPAMDASVYIIVNSNSNPASGDVYHAGVVGINTAYQISAANAGETKLNNAVFVHIYDELNGTIIQSVEFHASCSQPLGIGDQFGANVIMGLITEDGAVCGETSNEDCCENGGKPAKITVTYTGEDCSATQTSQDAGKWDCSGDPLSAPTVWIKSNDDSDPWDNDFIWFEGAVNLDGSYSIDAANAGETKLRSKTFIHIFDMQGGTVLQSIEFHTSCSQPLAVGDQFGANLFSQIELNNGSICSAPGTDLTGLAYNVVNGPYGPFDIADGNLTLNIHDEDDLTCKLNCVIVSSPAPCSIPPPPCVLGDPIIDALCDDNGTPSDPTDDTYTYTIEVNNNGNCASTFSISPSDGSCDDCCADGEKIAKITMLYTGEDCSASQTTQTADNWDCSGDPAMDPSVYIISNDNMNPNDMDFVWFEGTVLLNETFTIDAAYSGEIKIKNRTFVHIFDMQGGTLLQSVEFHTSCSQPLGINDQFGANKILSLTHESGISCGAGGGDDCCEEGFKPAKITVTYTGEDCTATQTAQPADKWDCDGDPLMDASVYIISNDKNDPNNMNNVWFAGVVALDGSYMIDAANAGRTKLKSKTYIHIFDMQGGTLLQTVEFHSSCSAPLGAADQYGANAFSEIVMQDGTTCTAGSPTDNLAYDVVHGPFGPFPLPVEGAQINITDDIDPSAGFFCYELPIPPSCQSVPIELLYFSAYREGEAVQLDWETITESNNRGFEVYRSTDGSDWELIDFVEGVGNSFTAQNYLYKDTHPNQGWNYYRLRQVDFDDTFSWTKIEGVYFKNGNGELSVFPNPSKGMIQYVLPNSTALDQMMTIEVYNTTGRLVYANQLEASLNGEIDLGAFAEGVYIILIQSGQQHYYSRILKAN